jgi:hypothetical protein
LLFHSPLRHTHTHTHTLACTTHMYKCTHNSCSQMTHTFNTQLIPQTIHAHSLSHTDHMHRCTCTHTHTPTTRCILALLHTQTLNLSICLAEPLSHGGTAHSSQSLADLQLSWEHSRCHPCCFLHKPLLVAYSVMAPVHKP